MEVAKRYPLTQAAQRLDEDERTMFNIGRQGETFNPYIMKRYAGVF